jgi:hypothetical protein
MPGSTPIGGCRPRELGSSHVITRGDKACGVGGVAGDVNTRAVGSCRRAAANSAVEFPTSSRRTNRAIALRLSRPLQSSCGDARAWTPPSLSRLQLITSFAYPSCWRPKEAAIQTTACLIRATRMMVPLFLPVLRRKSIVTGSFPVKASRRSCSMPSRAGWFWSLRS